MPKKDITRKHFRVNGKLLQVMKTCVLYVSRTGNTKRLAEAISELLKAPVHSITRDTGPSDVDGFDLLVIGTPVMGLGPTPEVQTFVKHLPECSGKKAILFCTYAIRQGRTLKTLEEELARRGYSTILSVSKRGLKPNKADFADVLSEIEKAVERLKSA
jgi:flavodoxin